MTHDELLAKINDPIELSRWLDKGVADKEITLSQAQIYWHNTNALRAVVELPMETKAKGMIMVRQANWSPEKIAGFFYEQGYATAMNKVIQAIEKELK